MQLLAHSVAVDESVEPLISFRPLFRSELDLEEDVGHFLTMLQLFPTPALTSLCSLGATLVIAMIAPTQSVASPEGLGFSVQNPELENGNRVTISFSVNPSETGTCYSLVSPSGNTVASACRTDSGWELHGGLGWTFHKDGELTAEFEENPRVSKIYSDDASKVKAIVGENGWVRVDLVEAERTARDSMESSISITSQGGIRVIMTPSSPTPR